MDLALQTCRRLCILNLWTILHEESLPIANKIPYQWILRYSSVVVCVYINCSINTQLFRRKLRSILSVLLYVPIHVDLVYLALASILSCCGVNMCVFVSTQPLEWLNRQLALTHRVLKTWPTLCRQHFPLTFNLSLFPGIIGLIYWPPFEQQAANGKIDRYLDYRKISFWMSSTGACISVKLASFCLEYNCCLCVQSNDRHLW